ncbi:MAG: DUF3775 domain-containing protein [Hyphomicrobiaceae bacterium]|nr:DUF3775 domain-containing protein [Hyphomicrobiaceae bacterium]
MKTPPSNAAANDDLAPALTIPIDKVCWIIVKAREFDVKEAPTLPDPGSNASDDKMINVLEDRRDDPVEQELRSFIGSLSDDEKSDLVALAWLGRDDNTLDDWPELRAEAARAQANHAGHTADYLLGEPLVSDFLVEALSLIGESCEGFDANGP